MSKYNRLTWKAKKLAEPIKSVGVLEPNTYTCAYCKGVFKKGRSDEEAMQESRKLWGFQPASNLQVICDDCFNKGQ